MSVRAEMKRASREKILDAAGKQMRVEGLSGAGVASVMSEAGLTHGAFYSHFKNKDDMLCQALSHALKDNRSRWLGPPKKESWAQRLSRLAKRYLTGAHRRDLANSCALASLCTEAGKGSDRFKAYYEQELIESLDQLCGGSFAQADADKQQEALAFMSMMIGSIALSRAVVSEQLSDQLLQAGTDLAGRLADQD